MTLAILCWPVLGCPGPTPHGSDAGTVTISGSMNVQYVTDTVTPVPGDFTGADVNAIEIGSDGTASVHAAVFNGSSFSIPNISSLAFLQLGGSLTKPNFYLASKSTTWDLSFPALGRANPAAVAVGTTLSATVTNMRPWQSTDDIEVTCAGAGLAWSSLQNVGTVPAAGATSFSGSLDYQAFTQAFGGTLIDTTKGDRLIATHLVQPSLSAGMTYAGAVVEAAVVSSSLTMTSGAANSVSAAFSTNLPGGTFNATVRTTDFAGLVSQVSPRAAQGDVHVWFGRMQYTSDFGEPWSAPDLVVAGFSSGAATNAPVSMSYVDPFPSSWPQVISLAADYSVSYALVGAAATTDTATMRYQDLASAAQTRGLGPVVGPVQSPTINGASLFADHGGVSTTPTLAWSAPTVGTANAYRVRVNQLSSSGGNTTSSDVAEMFTADTSITLPPNVLQSGQSYYFVVYAMFNNPVKVSVPFGQVFPEGQAPVFSGIMTP